jgi:hypothetical protein
MTPPVQISRSQLPVVECPKCRHGHYPTNSRIHPCDECDGPMNVVPNEVGCSGCYFIGTREEFETHACAERQYIHPT